METLKNLSTGKKIALITGSAFLIISIIMIIYFTINSGAPITTTPISNVPITTVPIITPISNAPIATYIGCYTDMAEPNRAIPYVGGGYTLEDCRDKAKFIGAKYFGLQYGDATTGRGQCLTSASTTIEAAKQYGPAMNCTAMPNSAVAGAQMGGPGSNALYSL